MTMTIPEPAGRVRAPQARVLLVEDDPHCRWALRSLMERVGYDCRVAADGREALEQAEAFDPDIILMDLMMPVLDGYEATRRLKQDARTRDIPVLVLTGNITPQGVRAAKQAGCDDLLPKPIMFQELLSRLDSLLHR